MKELVKAELDKRWPKGVGSDEKQIEDSLQREGFLLGVMWHLEQLIKN